MHVVDWSSPKDLVLVEITQTSSSSAVVQTNGLWLAIVKVLTIIATVIPISRITSTILIM
tara:strand:- start:72 stop:251 length:180 start_codon:yes stop_codon:yes gene_type:complete